jgi:DivIVA domain-containing protein
MKIKEILDKKFNKKIRSGYDPEDVDLFFDEVIKFLQEIHASTNALHEKDSLREQQLQ